MTIAAACRELAGLTPMLPAALRRDTGASTGLVTRWESTLTPVNTDVLSVMITLHHEIPAALAHAAGLVHEPRQARTLPGHLLALPRLAARMLVIGLHEDAARFDLLAGSWLRQTKRALGLRKPDLVLPAACPSCDPADAPALRMAGAEGFIRPGPAVEWVFDARIWCPQCGAAWAQPEWDWLLHLLETAGTP